jgi:hypothetical protein
MDRGDLQGAQSYFEQAAQLFQQLSDEPSLATWHLAASLSELAVLAEEQGRQDVARQWWEKSAQVFDTVSLEAEARGDHNTAAATRQQSEAIRRWTASQTGMSQEQREQARVSRSEWQRAVIRNLSEERARHNQMWASNLGRI